MTKTYGHTNAVSDISFCLQPGTLTVFLGPNGAGKTTTINIMTRIITPTAGEILYKGKNIFKNLQAWKWEFGAVTAGLMLVIYIRFLANTGFAASTLIEGKISVGIPLLEFNFFHPLLLWILIPSFVTGTLRGYDFLVPLCTRFPLSPKRIFLSGLYGILFQPIFLLLGIISLVGLLPLFFIQDCIPWLITGLFFLCLCGTFSIFISFLFIIISTRFKLSGIFAPLFKIVLGILLLANFSFYWGGDVVVFIFNKSFTLSSNLGNPSILTSLSFLRPST